MQCASVDNREDLDGLAALIEFAIGIVPGNVTIHVAGALAKTWVLYLCCCEFLVVNEKTSIYKFNTIPPTTLDDWIVYMDL